MAHRQQQFTKIVLDVAGDWRAREDVVAAIAARSPGWKYAGRLLVEIATHRTFHLDVMDREGALAGSAAQQFRYESPEVSADRPAGLRLRFTAPAGTLDMARLALTAAATLATAGATRVECRSSGGSVAAASLGTLAADTAPAALASAFVALQVDAASARSCGMQSLGLPDALVVSSAEDARAVLGRFQAGLIAGLKPKAGARFDAFGLAHEVCADIDREDPRFNPYGRWRLSA